MNKFHPAKPVSVYNAMNENIFVNLLKQQFYYFLRKKFEEKCSNFNWLSYVVYREIYDAQVKGLSAYLEITETGELFVHVEPCNLPSTP